MVSIVPIVCDIESDYGSVKNADLFDKRLVEIRKRFNHGIDPIVKSELGIDIEVAQRLLDSDMTKSKVAEMLGIKEYQLNRYIINGYLTYGNHRGKSTAKKSRFQFYKNGDYVVSGTYSEISEITNISIASLRYYRTSKYKQRHHTARYRLVPIV
jgi:hypothetical protein